MRVAYVSQHALHHLEDHLDMTPNQYIRRRYQKGEDKEDDSKVRRGVGLRLGGWVGGGGGNSASNERGWVGE